MLRVYDKLAELEHSQDEVKRKQEESRWKQSGWQGEPVTRVEFQLRTRVLKELGVSRPEEVAEKLDAIWAYCTQKWVRLSMPDTATRASRWQVHPYWQLVRGVVFHHVCEPAERHRSSIGATVQQVLGGLRSLLASQGELPELPDIDLIDETSLGRMLGQYWLKAQPMMTRKLMQRHGLEGSKEYLQRRHESTRATFWSVVHRDLDKPDNTGGIDEYF